MKKIAFLFLMIALRAFSQVPATINYQGIARDASGAAITNTTVGLTFNISTSTSTNFYSEIQTAVPVNSLGLFSTKIGINTPLPSSGWEDTPAILNVLININGSGFVSLGSQTLSSVPYALYALNSGSSLPPGTRDGQTLRWDSISSTWLNSGNLTNDDVRVGVGVFPQTIKSKFSVATTNPFDSAAITAIHYVAQNKTAAIRGMAIGSTVGGSGNPYSTAIFGGQHVAYNASTGFAIGNGGYGSSKKLGIGLAGFGATQINTGTAVGIYATVDTLSPGTNKYAAIFDRGAVFIGDSLMLNPAKNPGSLGDVLTLTGFNGRAKWKPAGGPWQRAFLGGGFTTYLANNNDDVSIGLPSGVGASEKLHLHEQGGDAYMQLSTFNNANSVGFVFGESANLNKASLRFDNFSNTLVYQVGGKSLLHIDGVQKSVLVGKIPFGAASLSSFNVYDSITITALRPVAKVINTNTALNMPTSLFIGHNNFSGINLTYRKGPGFNTFSLEDNSFGNVFHTFNDAGRFYPGSDGTVGKAYIQGGNFINDNLSLVSSTNGNIVHVGYTQLGNNGSQFPAIQVLEFTSTMPATAGGNIQFNLASYILSSNQIESVQVLVTTANRIVPQNYTFFSGFECQYEIIPNSPVIIVWATNTNSAQVLNQPVKIVVTVKK
ncbi:MAG: hypothetical protein H0W61_17505 [Bacteroidetes bacterium]|nr:hypothetical protein [Bacteroidota bacterium]